MSNSLAENIYVWMSFLKSRLIILINYNKGDHFDEKHKH